ncbi:MAG: NAD(P)-binding domain-containing protein, partial [Pseudomonadota bacterium]
MTTSVGVIGLGNMGRGIARNQAKAGHDLLVWDLSEDARNACSDIGRVAPPHEMAAEAEVIIFVVPGSKQIDEMLDPMLAKAGPNLILWDFTTSDPVYTKRLAVRAAEAGVPYMDAGMTGGGAKGADDGTMTLMIGGDVAVLNRSMVLGNDPAGYIACCLALKDLDYLRHLSGVKIPILYVGGSEDKGASPETMGAMAAATPGGTY